MKRHHILAGIALVCSSWLVHAGDKVDLARAEEIVGGRCFLCHGPEGASASPVFPRLAGQHSEYIARQLADFKSGKRQSDTMQAQVGDLTADEMKALGVFFEAKKIGGRPKKDEELLGVGRYIFKRGNAFSGVPACSSCHGDEGHGTPQLPRLAGQHPRYIEDQLKQFAERKRVNDNAVMHTVASKMTELETRAVAEYIATLD